jgi:hypothetical protein
MASTTRRLAQIHGVLGKIPAPQLEEEWGRRRAPSFGASLPAGHRVAGYPDMLSFAGRVAVVTGAGQGIGAEVARALAECGAKVAVLDQDGASAAATAAAIGGGSKGGAESWQCDVSDKQQVEAVMLAVNERFGSVDVLVSNAGCQPTRSACAVCELVGVDNNSVQDPPAGGPARFRGGGRRRHLRCEHEGHAERLRRGSTEAALSLRLAPHCTVRGIHARERKLLHTVCQSAAFV